MLSLLPILFRKYLFLFCVYECLACMHVWAPRVCLMSADAGRGCQIPWHWSYCFEAPHGCSELNPGSCVIAAAMAKNGASAQPGLSLLKLSFIDFFPILLQILDSTCHSLFKKETIDISVGISLELY